MKLSIPNIKLVKITKNLGERLPKTPGVYLFSNTNDVLYVGKAVNLQNRVKSYFLAHVGKKTNLLIKEAKTLAFIKVTSELEALLLESELIKKYQPKYNVILKDDKHALYIKITNEKYPRVQTTRKVSLQEKNLAIFGPFPSSKAVSSVLKMVRKIFPYSDHKVGKKACLYSQISLCDPCPSYIENLNDLPLKKQLLKIYCRNLKHLILLLQRKFSLLFNQLEKEMISLAKEQKFEEAKEIKQKLIYLNYITGEITPSSSFLENPNLTEDLNLDKINDLQTVLNKYLKFKSLKRIECFDVAHLSGSLPAASMVTFINGEAEKNLYRKFRIRQSKTNSDVDSIKEVAQRRLTNLKKWGRPDLIVVDGGLPQVKVFLTVFKQTQIPVIGLAKRYETVVIPPRNQPLNYTQVRLKNRPALLLLQNLRDEAHRFAQSYHKQLFRKYLFNLA